MRVVSVIATLGFGLAFSTAASAGSFDGNWVGQVPPIGKCNAQSVMNLTVSGDTLAGQIHNPGNVRGITGKIDADGNATFTVMPSYSGTLKFTTDHFEGDWDNGPCLRHVLGDRALTAAQVADFVAQRKQAQATYDDLSARAEAGDKTVDYAALRAAYPLTKQWDVFGNKTGPLMNQANAASKGKDCATVLSKVDQVLKIDFTIDAAHALRSDCLEDTDRAKSRIESAIADGLIKSLMNSGDGDAEKTAYVVMTTREEMDVLANRHIQIKTRQTEIRGSDGRFYDQIQGISVRSGFGSVDVRTKAVFFDVTAMVQGRNSRMAQSAALEAAAQQ